MDINNKKVYRKLLQVLIGFLTAYSLLFFAIGMGPVRWVLVGFLIASLLSYFLLSKGLSLPAFIISVIAASISGFFHTYYLGIGGAFFATFFAIFFAIYLFTPRSYTVALISQTVIVMVFSLLSFYWILNQDPIVSLPAPYHSIITFGNVGMIIFIISGGVFLTRKAMEEAEEKLVHNRNILKAIYNSTADASLLIGLDKRIISYNKPAIELARKHYQTDELAVGMHMNDLLKGAQLQAFEDNFKKTINGEEIEYIMEMELDGEYYWFETTYIRVLGENDRLWGVGIMINDITEKQRYREEIKKLALVASEISNAVLITDKDEHIEWANAGFTKITGYELDEIRGKKPADFLQGPETSEASKTRLREHIQKGQPVRETILNYAKDGSEYWLDMTIQPIRNNDGEIERFIAVETDVTESKRQEEQLRRNEELLAEMGRTAQIGAWEYYLDTGEVIWTDETYRIYNLPLDTKIYLEEAIKYFQPEGQEVIRSMFEHCLKTGESFHDTLPMISATSEEKFVRFIGKADEIDGKVKRIYGAIQDVTQEVKNEQSIREREMQLKSINENIQDGLYRSTPDKGMVYANEAFAKIFGYDSVDEVIEHDINDFYANKKDREEFLELLEKNRKVRNKELLLVKKNGTQFWGLISGTINDDETGQQYIDGSIRDITRLKKTQEALVEAKEKAEKASMAKAEFLSTMSHEIRTPMNAVIGMSELMMMEDPRDDQLENLQTLKFSAENLLNLINDILDYSKIEAGRVEFEQIDFRPRRLLEGLYQGLKQRAEENNVALHLDIAEKVPAVIVGDPTRLSQVLSNLMTNAIKFTEDGSVTTRLRVKEQRDKEVVLHFEVADTGVGIPKDKQEDIFKSFQQADASVTRKYGGTGLGLAIIKNLLDSQNSSVHVESEPGEGSKFYFELTFGYYADQQQDDKPDDNVRSTVFNNLEGMKVLVVEDNLINQRLTVKFLEKWNVETFTANNGQEAVEMSKGLDFDLILMDLQMPVLDGYGASEKIREFDTDVPILALTASAMLENQERVYSSYMNDFITKPVNPKDLNHKISKYQKVKE